jgi:acetolactate synthase-1/2/3 large subunit
MSGSRLFAEMLNGYGVSHIFFVPVCMAKAMAAMEDMPIKRIMAHGEKAAAYMADGYGRASGKPGFCFAQAAGGSNLAAGLRDAYMAGSPVIAISGGRIPDKRYKYTYQEVEDFPQFDAVTKFSVCVDIASRIPDLLRQAFREATSGAPGPVHLQIGDRGGHISEQEAEMEVLIEEQFARAPAFRPEPEMHRVREAAALLGRAARPLILAGGGIVRSGAERELVQFAEKMQIPVVTSLNAKAVIVDHHPLAVGVAGSYSRACANQALMEADLVFFIGSHAGGQVTHFWRFPPPGTAVIQLDISPSELGRNYPNKVSLLGDAKVTLQALIQTSTERRSDVARLWTTRVQQLVSEWRKQEEPNRNSDAVPLRPERVCTEISEALPPDAVLVSDTGHAGMWTGQMVNLRHPTQKYIRCAGSLGWGFPGALGVKCALPERPVLCFTGDGGFYYHIAELETAARHNINAVVVVNNNAGLNQEISINAAAYDGTPRGRWTDMWKFNSANFARIAEDFGCVGIRIEKPGELSEVLPRAFGMERPVVLDVVTDPQVTAKRVPH